MCSVTGLKTTCSPAKKNRQTHSRRKRGREREKQTGSDGKRGGAGRRRDAEAGGHEKKGTERRDGCAAGSSFHAGRIISKVLRHQCVLSRVMTLAVWAGPPASGFHTHTEHEARE